MSNSEELFNRAVRFLSRRDHSRFELEKKLRRHSNRRQVDDVLQRLQDLGYLDDARYARLRAVHLRRNRCWGNRLIVQDLKKKRVGGRTIEKVLAALAEEHSEADALASCIRNWEMTRGKPENPRQLKRLFDRCVRLGYPPSMVRELLGPLFDSISWKE